MAYTQTDLDAVDKAILDFALGKRAGRITIGPHTVEFAVATSGDLQSLRGLIAQGVVGFSPRSVARNAGRG